MTDDSTPFTWGSGGARLTPEEIAQRRKDVAAAMLQNDGSKIFAPGTRGAGGEATQGLAYLAKSAMIGMDAREANQASKANAADNTAMIAGLLGNAGAGPVATAPSAAPAAAAPVASLDPETSGYIKAAADKFGVDPAYLSRTAMIESGGRSDATNPSGAAGLFQFMPKTAKEYGLDNPLDPEDSAMAAAELAKDNRAALAASLGRDPTNAELYLAHQQGAGGAAALLANPDAPAAQAVGRQAVLQNGGTDGMTAGQFANQWLTKFGGGGPSPAVAQVAAAQAGGADPAALPAAVAPTQGFAVPGAAVAKVASGLSAVNPGVLRALTSPYADDATKKIAGIVLQQQMTPKSHFTQETDKDGNVWNIDQTSGQKTVALKAENDPKWGIVGKDQYGQQTYGYAPTREEYAAQKAKTAAAPAPDQPDLTNVHGKEYMDTIIKQDPKYASQVQAILEGRAPYPAGMLLKTPYGQKLASDVTQADPTFEAGNATARVKVRNEFESGGVGSPAGQITAGNAAIRHAGEMSDSLEEMKAHPGMAGLGEAGVPFMSYYANKLHNAAVQGTAEGAPLNDFKTAKNHFSEEVTKFYAGSAGSEAERTRALANIDEAKSLPELRSAIRKEAGLMQDKVNVLQDRWRNGMGPLVPDFPLINPKSQVAFDKINQRAALSSEPASTTVAPAPIAASPVPAGGIPHGAVVKLAQSPTPEMKAHFDEIFGAGAADKILGGGK